MAPPSIFMGVTQMHTPRASLARSSLVVTLALAPFAACDCGETLTGLPTPDAFLVFNRDETPPAEHLVVDGGAVAVGAVGAITFSLENRGNAALLIETVSLVSDEALCPSASAAFFLPVLLDGVDVKPGEARAIDVSFAPTTAQPSCAVLEVATNDTTPLRLRAVITARGDAAQLCADRNIVDFGTVLTGEHVDDVVTLTSCGTRPLTITSASTSGAISEPFEVPSLPSTPLELAVGESFALAVAFDPELPGSWSLSDGGVITFTGDDGAAYTINLIGNAEEPPRCHIQVVPDVVQFGSVAVGFTAEQTVIIRNIGALPCVFESADIVADGAGGATPFTRALVDPLVEGLTLQPLESGVVTLTYAPDAVVGAQSDVLRVLSDDPVEPTIDVPLEGTSVEVTPCLLQALPTALNFGSQTVNRSTSTEVAMVNVGTEMCVISSIELVDGAPDFSIVIPTLANICNDPNIPPQFCDLFGGFFGTIVPPGEQVSFVVSFRPEQIGIRDGLVDFTYQMQGQGNPELHITVPLRGTGVGPCLAVSPQDIDFGNVVSGAVATETVQVSNCGASDLVVRGLTLRSSSHPDFDVDAASLALVPFPLAAGEARDVQLAAAPTAAGIASAGSAMFGTLDVLSDDDAVAVRLRANTPACTNGLVCTPLDLEFGEVLTGEPTVKTVVCSNPTGANVNINPTIAPGGSAGFSVVSAPAAIGAGADGVIRVRFLSNTAVNNAQATLDVGAALCTGGPVRVPLHARASDEDIPACPTADSFEPLESWRWQGGPGASGNGTHPESVMSWATPLVSRLEDTDGDGAVTRDDMPRVIAVTFDAAELAEAFANPQSATEPIPSFIRAIDGATGEEVWTSPDNAAMRAQSESTPALADLDGDGLVEIVFQKHHILPTVGSTDPDDPNAPPPDPNAPPNFDPTGGSLFGKFKSGYLIALNFDGTFKWQSDEWSRSDKDGEDGGAPAIGDVDGDGYAEIAWADSLFDHNGRLLWHGDHAFTASTGHGSLPVLADVDGVPGLEVIVGPRVYRADGTILWSRDDLEDGHPAVADVDGDGDNEVIVRGNASLRMLDGLTGADMEHTPVGGGIPTNPAVLDVDGDGLLEVADAASPILSVYDSELDEVWRAPIIDQSGASGPAGFDFDGDGSASVVYADEQRLFAYDADGDAIYSAERRSATIFEYATVADVDNDGHADMLIVDNANLPTPGVGGVRCYKNAGTSWAQARGIWSQHAYVEALISELGAPLFEPVPTPVPSFRAARARCE